MPFGLLVLTNSQSFLSFDPKQHLLGIEVISPSQDAVCSILMLQFWIQHTAVRKPGGSYNLQLLRHVAIITTSCLPAYLSASVTYKKQERSSSCKARNVWQMLCVKPEELEHISTLQAYRCLKYRYFPQRILATVAQCVCREVQEGGSHTVLQFPELSRDCSAHMASIINWTTSSISKLHHISAPSRKLDSLKYVKQCTGGPKLTHYGNLHQPVPSWCFGLWLGLVGVVGQNIWRAPNWWRRHYTNHLMLCKSGGRTTLLCPTFIVIPLLLGILGWAQNLHKGRSRS